MNSGYRMAYSILKRNSGYLELKSGFQSQGLLILQAKVHLISKFLMILYVNFSRLPELLHWELFIITFIIIIVIIIFFMPLIRLNGYSMISYWLFKLMVLRKCLTYFVVVVVVVFLNHMVFNIFNPIVPIPLKWNCTGVLSSYLLFQ